MSAALRATNAELAKKLTKAAVMIRRLSAKLESQEAELTELRQATATSIEATASLHSHEQAVRSLFEETMAKVSAEVGTLREEVRRGNVHPHSHLGVMG